MEGLASASIAAPAPSRKRRRRRVPLTPWRPPAWKYRAWYAAWESERTWVELPKRAQQAFRWLWILGGQDRDGWLSVPTSGAAVLLRMDPRTWRRSCAALAEAGLVDVEHGGGAHAACNRYRARAVAPLTEHREGPRPPLASPPIPGAPPDADLPLEELLSPVDGAPGSEPPVLGEDLPDAAVEALAEEYAPVTGETPDQVATWLRTQAVSTVVELAAHYGVRMPEWRPRGVLREDALAWRMVRDYLGAWGVHRAPTARELGQALAVVRWSGTESWTRYRAAADRQAKMISGWTTKGRPSCFGYLWTHLQRAGAVYDRPYDTGPPPDPPGSLPEA